MSACRSIPATSAFGGAVPRTPRDLSLWAAPEAQAFEGGRPSGRPASGYRPAAALGSLPSVAPSSGRAAVRITHPHPKPKTNVRSWTRPENLTHRTPKNFQLKRVARQ